MKCLFTKIQSNIAKWQYIAIHSNTICNMALTHIVSPLIANYNVELSLKYNCILFTETSYKLFQTEYSWLIYITTINGSYLHSRLYRHLCTYMDMSIIFVISVHIHVLIRISMLAMYSYSYSYVYSGYIYPYMDMSGSIKLFTCSIKLHNHIVTVN